MHTHIQLLSLSHTHTYISTHAHAYLALSIGIHSIEVCAHSPHPNPCRTRRTTGNFAFWRTSAPSPTTSPRTRSCAMLLPLPTRP